VTRQQVKLYTPVAAGEERNSELRGTLGHDGLVPSSGHRATIQFHGATWDDAEFRAETYPVELDGSNTFALTRPYAPRWWGPRSVEGLLLAALYYDSGLIGVGSQRVILTDGSPVASPDANVQVNTPTYRAFIIKVTGPPGANLMRVEADGTVHYDSHVENPSPRFSDYPVTLQAIAGFREVGERIQVTCLVEGRTVVVRAWVSGDAPGVDVECGSVPQYVGPPSLFEYAPRATSFEFEPAIGAVSSLRFCSSPYGLSEADCATVYTDESSVSLEQLLALGLERALPSRATIRWNVVSREAPSVDAFLDPERVGRALSVRAHASEGDEAEDRWFSYE
jgi:hypothetical protein